MPDLDTPNHEGISLASVVDAANDVGGSAFLGEHTSGSERVLGVSSDSTSVAPGDLYAGLRGARHHGASFASDAAAAGASALLTDPEGALLAAGCSLPTVVTPDPRAVLGAVSAAVFGHPDRGLLTLGVTGTNGKTTVTYLLDAGLRAAGHRTGLIGTVETRIGDEVQASARTTPEAPAVQGLLATMVASGCTAVAMEVSSHALALGRVDGTTFDVALFTNLSPDHLDFHKDLEDYFATKAELFTQARARRAVIDIDTAWGQRLFAETTLPKVSVSSGDRTADWVATEVELGPIGSTFRARGPSGENVSLAVGLPGPFNVANALGAFVTLVAAGVPLGDAAQGIADLAGVPGRMEAVDGGQPFLALVDYAHTADAVHTLLASVRSTVTGPVVVVLGCGGDRDPHKRPAMGAAAVQGADTVILTSDNPRSEDPLDIIGGMEVGVAEALTERPQTRVLVEPDRGAAIALAVQRADPTGAVVIAGKGHETGQEALGVVRPFDDRDVLREELQRWVSR